MLEFQSTNLAGLQLGGGDAASGLTGGDASFISPHHYTPPETKLKHLDDQFGFGFDPYRAEFRAFALDLVPEEGAAGWELGVVERLMEGLVPNVDCDHPGSGGGGFMFPPPVPTVPDVVVSSSVTPGAGALPAGGPRPFKNAGPQVMIDPATGSPVLVRLRPGPIKIDPDLDLDLDRLASVVVDVLSDLDTTNPPTPTPTPRAGSSEAAGADALVPRPRSRSPGPPHRRRSSHRSPIPPRWTDRLLDMTTKELNQFFKSKDFGANEIAELKTCRRRIKNRGYTRDSRKRTYSAGRAATPPRA